MGDKEIGVLRVGGEEAEVKPIRAGIVSGDGQHLGQHAGNGRIGGMRIVEFLEERQGVGIVLGDEHRSQLGVEGGIVRGAGERGAEEGCGLGILLAQDEDVRQAGVGGDRAGIFQENAAIGGFGGIVLAGLFG